MQIGSSILSMLKEGIFGPPPASSPLSLSRAFSPSIHSFIHIPKEMVSPFGELIRLAIQPTPSERARTPRRLAPSISNKARRERTDGSHGCRPIVFCADVENILIIVQSTWKVSLCALFQRFMHAVYINLHKYV